MRKIVFVAILIVCAVTTGYFVLQDRQSPTVSDYGLYFPGLVDQINDVTEIRITTNEEKFSIRNRDEKWILDVADNYPVRFDLVRNFLIGMSQLRKLEPKTNDSDKHSVLNLLGVGVEGSSTILVELIFSQSEPSAQIFVGTSRISVKNPSLKEYYVRDPGQSQTWLTESGLEVTTIPFDWIDPEISDLDSSQVKEVAIMRSDAAPIRVHRSSIESGDFQLEGIPQGHKVRHQYLINDIGDLFRRLNFIDVRSADDWTSSGVSVTAFTFSGLKLNARAGSGDFEGYYIFSAEVDDSSSEEILNQTTMLNAKFEGWVYKLSDQRTETINSRFEDLIEPVEDN